MYNLDRAALVSCDDLRRDHARAVRRGSDRQARKIRKRADRLRCRVDRWSLGRVVVRRGARFDRKQIEAGTQIEMEHTDSRRKARYIAKQHLTEDPRYYAKLCKVWPNERGCERL